MKRRTRNYAKRQLAWMRRLPDVHEIDLTGAQRGRGGRRGRTYTRRPGGLGRVEDEEESL